MNKILHILIIVFQFALTFIATVCIYMISAILDSNFGIDGLFGLIIIQPILAVIFSILTIIACTIVGLPIRLIKSVNKWWRDHWYISIMGIIVGSILFLLAFSPSLQEVITVQLDGEDTLKEIPNLTLICVGWFTTAFNLLHIYPPNSILLKIKYYLHQL
jgi:hypothetical protein